MALGRLARDARQALLKKKPISTLATEARVIAERYGAELVEDADPEIFVFGRGSATEVSRSQCGTFSPSCNAFGLENR